MSKLRTALEKYLSVRKGLGYKYEHQTRRLADFVTFMEKRGGGWCERARRVGRWSAAGEGRKNDSEAALSSNHIALIP